MFSLIVFYGNLPDKIEELFRNKKITIIENYILIKDDLNLSKTICKILKHHKVNYNFYETIKDYIFQYEGKDEIICDTFWGKIIINVEDVENYLYNEYIEKILYKDKIDEEYGKNPQLIKNLWEVIEKERMKAVLNLLNGEFESENMIDEDDLIINRQQFQSIIERCLSISKSKMDILEDESLPKDVRDAIGWSMKSIDKLNDMNKFL